MGIGVSLILAPVGGGWCHSFLVELGRLRRTEREPHHGRRALGKRWGALPGAPNTGVRRANTG